jgi:hypothetical protein
MIIKNLKKAIEMFIFIEEWVDEKIAKKIVPFTGWSGLSQSVTMTDIDNPKISYYSLVNKILLFSIIHKPECEVEYWIEINLTPIVSTYPAFVSEADVPGIHVLLSHRLNQISKYGFITSFMDSSYDLDLVYVAVIPKQALINKQSFVGFCNEIRTEITVVFEEDVKSFYMEMIQSAVEQNRDIEFETNTKEED